MEKANVVLAQIIHEKMNEVNIMKTRVETESLHRRNAIWNQLNENHAPYFPRLSIGDLTEHTIGIYQIKLAPSYVQDKIDHERIEVFQFNEHMDEPGFLRIRIYSRFQHAATRYQIWIAYQENSINEENDPILGYYCTCSNGARTLGSCSKCNFAF